MKRLFCFSVILMSIVVWNASPGGAAYGPRKVKGKMIMPGKCRTSKYTCIVKKHDGVQFICVLTTKQRQQNVRKKMRAVRKIKCLERFPVQYKEPEPEGNVGKDNG